MASKSKVNVRFVVTLSIVLSALFLGVAATAYFLLSHSGAELESMGDQAMKAKDFKEAITYYGKAYSDDQTNIQRLTKYCDAMLAYTPENQSLYQDYYWKRLVPAKLVRANLLKDDVAAQYEILDIFARNMYESGYDRRGWDHVIESTENSLAPFEAGTQAEGWEKLKRFRGLALFEIASNDTDPLDDQKVATLESDLNTALSVNPDDERVALALVNWYNLRAAKALDRGDTAAQADLLAKAQTSLDAYRAKHPDSVSAAISAIANKVDAALRAADPKKFSAEQRFAMMQDAGVKLQPDFAALLDIVRRIGPETLDSGDLYRLNRLDRFVHDNHDDESIALINQAVQKNAGKADLMYMAGRLAEDRGEQEDAIAHYQALLDLPIPPLSLDGVILYEERIAALGRQAEAAMALWEGIDQTDDFKKLDPAQQDKAKAAALDRIANSDSGFRQKLALEVPPTNLALLLIDAKIKYAQGDLADAKSLLEDHLRQTNQSDPDSVRLAGIVAMRLNQPGSALSLFQRLVELQPNSPRAKLLVADTFGTLDRHQEALAVYREVLGLDPKNTYAQEKVKQLTSVITGDSKDPVEKLMLEANKYWLGDGVAPDRDHAIQILEQGLGQAPNEIRIMAMLTTYYYNVNRIDEAKALCARGLAIAPANDPTAERLKYLKTILDSPDQYTAGLTLIDQSPASPIEKLIAKVRLAQRYAKPDDARKFLDQAVQLAPNDASVIEFRFTDAVTNKNLDEAATLADQAAAGDIDHLKGATFKARLLVAQGKKADAIELLKGAAHSGMATPEVWRFLGQVQSDLGESTSNDHLREDALASFNEALRMRPNDLGTILDTLKTLVHLNRYEPALDLARKSETIGRGNPDFQDLSLRLEASVGDKQRVLMMRRAILKDQPNNDINKLALLQTDVELGQWSEARALLDQLRKTKDSLILLQLDARWHSDQGDRDSARKLYLDYIAAQKAAGSVAPEPYIALAQFLIGVGDTQGGLASLQEARQFQNPKTLDVDRTLGMMLFDLNDLEHAIPILQGFLAAGVPDDYPTLFAVRARHAEALLRQNKFSEAEASLDAAGPAGAQDMTLMLLRASARQNQKDDQGALKLINDAIAKYPNEPLGYVKRAELSSNDAASINDAIADLDTAIRLKPDLWNALQLRALLKIRSNRQEEAMADLQQVVKGNPDADGPRTALLQALVESDKFDQAVDIANGAANQRPRNVKLLMSLGDFFSKYAAARPDAITVAQRFYDRAWKLGPDPQVAIIYTRSLLRTRNTNPDFLEFINQILTTPALDMAKNPELLMNHAILLNRKTAYDQSRVEAAQALQLVIKSPGDTSAMLDQLGPVFGDPYTKADDRAALIAFVQSLDMSGLPDLWADFFRARFKFLDPQGKDEALNRLRQVIAAAKDPTLQTVARQFLSAALIGAGDAFTTQGNTAAAQPLYEEAVQVIRGALEIDPNNAEALNNAAYVLTENLKRPAEALPLAEKAIQIAPNSGPYWDTLGLVYLELSRFDDADKALNKAVAAGGSIDDRMQLGIKLIRVKIGKGDKAAAQKILIDANNATSPRPELKARYQDQLNSLQKDIDNIK